MTLVKSHPKSTTRKRFPLNSFLDDFFTSDWSEMNSRNGNDSTSWLPSANVKESKKAYTVELAVPGYQKNELHLEVDGNNALHIRGNKKDDSTKQNGNYTRREFSNNSFNRTFQLPRTILGDKISAHCKNGVLTVNLPKKETSSSPKNSKKIEIS